MNLAAHSGSAGKRLRTGLKYGLGQAVDGDVRTVIGEARRGQKWIGLWLTVACCDLEPLIVGGVWTMIPLRRNFSGAPVRSLALALLGGIGAR